MGCDMKTRLFLSLQKNEMFNYIYAANKLRTKSVSFIRKQVLIRIYDHYSTS